jgi:hypothetical protein
MTGLAYDDLDRIKRGVHSSTQTGEFRFGYAAAQNWRHLADSRGANWRESATKPLI